MRILLVKTSSLGDVIHNLPVVGDILRHHPDAHIDWCVEEGFASIPRLHPGVDRVIPVAIRRWRRQLLQGKTWGEIGAFRHMIGDRDYDFVIDTQGLLKSALLARQARGLLCGYDAQSIREPLASRFYARRFSVPRQAHAVVRNRQLVAAILGDPAPSGLDYGLPPPAQRPAWLPNGPYVVLLSATSRDDKLWPETHWIALGHALRRAGYGVILPGGKPFERERAARLAAAIPEALAAPALDLPGAAACLGLASGVVGVDTGLTHLAAALTVPTVALYVATEPGLTGILGSGYAVNLGGKGQLPTPDAVFAALLPGLHP